MQQREKSALGVVAWVRGMSKSLFEYVHKHKRIHELSIDER